jgi:hypothetical protein
MFVMTGEYSEHGFRAAVLEIAKAEAKAMLTECGRDKKMIFVHGFSISDPLDPVAPLLWPRAKRFPLV